MWGETLNSSYAVTIFVCEGKSIQCWIVSPSGIDLSTYFSANSSFSTMKHFSVNGYITCIRLRRVVPVSSIG